MFLMKSPLHHKQTIMTELGLNLHHAGRANQPDLTICPHRAKHRDASYALDPAKTRERFENQAGPYD